MWYHMDGCANQYSCASDIYLLSCLTLEYSIIIINIAVVSPVNGKDVEDGLNDRDKLMLKLKF